MTTRMLKMPQTVANSGMMSSAMVAAPPKKERGLVRTKLINGNLAGIETLGAVPVEDETEPVEEEDEAGPVDDEEEDDDDEEEEGEAVDDEDDDEDESTPVDEDDDDDDSIPVDEDDEEDEESTPVDDDDDESIPVDDDDELSPPVEDSAINSSMSMLSNSSNCERSLTNAIE